jgi:hypothetical protein
MRLSRKQLFLVTIGLIAICISVALIHLRTSPTDATLRQDGAQPFASATNPSPAMGNERKALPISPPQATIDWAKQYNGANDYFDFVSKAARRAFDGDGRAALYISKALYTCTPIIKQFAHSRDPESDFNAYWATKTKAPQWVVEKARKDFNSCVGFINGDAFATLPDRPGGYTSIAYWMDQASANNDPVAQSLQAGSDIAKTLFDKSSDANAKSMESAQAALNNAITSKDPAALFQIGQLLSDGHASSDPLQGFAVSILACNLGYDCTANNPELFRGCAAQGECPPGTDYSDIIKKAVGPDGYAQAYARAQQLEDALARKDTNAVQQFVKLRPTL